MQARMGNRILGKGKPVLIIAEAGVNHNGDLKIAKQLIRAAKDADADVVKFQSFTTEEVVTASAPLVQYQKAKHRGHQTQYAMLKKLELNQKAHEALAAYAKRLGIVFLSTPDDYPAVSMLDRLGVPAFKIGSSDLTNVPFLKYVAAYGKPVILSTGMGTLQEVREAVHAIRSVRDVPLVVMHTTTLYPCPLEDVHMRVLQTLQQSLKVPVGYSDHTAGVSAAMAAVSLGACVIEKHLTLSRTLPGPDHKASYEPGEFKIFVRLIREIEQCLGSTRKAPTIREKKDMPYIRKGIVARTDIRKGEKITKAQLAVKRPQTGLLPKEYFRLLGKRAKRNIAQDSPIKRSDIG